MQLWEGSQQEAPAASTGVAVQSPARRAAWKTLIVGLVMTGVLFLSLVTSDAGKPAPGRLATPIIRTVRAPDSDLRAAQERRNTHAVTTYDGAGIVSDNGGAIAELLLHYAVESEPELGQIYRDLFRQLPGDVRLQICCPSRKSVDEFAARWGPAAMWKGREVHVVNVDRPISVWARDRRISRQHPSNLPAASFVPASHSSYDEEKTDDLLLQTLLWPTGLVPGVMLTTFHLEGGNVVANEQHVFIGTNLFTDNANRFPTPEYMSQELLRTFGRQAITVQGKDGEVPWCHTDMYLTPVTNNLVLVANPSEGIALLGGATRCDARKGDQPVELSFNLTDARSPLQRRFDDVADQVRARGYEVRRIPALMNVEQDWMVTYNNVLMDERNGRRSVYMPVYNIPLLDQAAAQVYQDLGFDVYGIDVSAIFRLGGAIRCLANVTLRQSHEYVSQSRPNRGRGSIQTYDVEEAQPPENPDQVRETLSIDSTDHPRPLSDALGDEAISDAPGIRRQKLRFPRRGYPSSQYP